MTDMENIRRERLQLGWTVEFINLERRSWIQFIVLAGLILATEMMRRL